MKRIESQFHIEKGVNIMKLFKVNYIDDGDDGSYLTVGNSKEEVEEREKDKLCDKLSCCMGCWVFEVNEVDGHKIFVD